MNIDFRLTTAAGIDIQGEWMHSHLRWWELPHRTAENISMQPVVYVENILI